MTAKTLHTLVIDRVMIHGRIYDGRIKHVAAAIRRCVRDGVLAKIVTEARRDFDRSQYPERNRDFRSGVGSGRSAHWLDTSFARYSIIAQAIHRDTGWTGEAVRLATRAVMGYSNAYDHQSDLESLPPLPASVTSAPWMTRVYSEEHESRMCAEYSPEAKRWYYYIRWTLAAEFAAAEGKRVIEETGRISGYLAASILSWQGRGGRDYSGCSGCESYEWLRQHPEHWDSLLARAPQGATGDGWEQVYPHETERAERLQADGYYQTLRVNDSIYTRRHPVMEPVLG